MTAPYAEAEAKMAMALAEAGFPGSAPAIVDGWAGVRICGVDGIPREVVWRAAELARLGSRRPLCWECTLLSTDPFANFRANDFCTAGAPLTHDCGIDREQVGP